MTPTNDAPVMVEPAFLLMKRGLFYRPGNAGYTGIKADAGRYEQSEADELSGVTAIHENDAPMFAPACWEDVKVKHLLGIIAERDRSLAALAAAPAGDGVDMAKYADMSIDEKANAMADDCVGDGWELVGYFREKARQAQATADSARDAATRLALARPRAAVGEQSRSRRLTEEEARELVGFEPETILTCLREWGYVEDAALQSPPAKVEV